MDATNTSAKWVHMPVSPRAHTNSVYRQGLDTGFTNRTYRDRIYGLGSPTGSTDRIVRQGAIPQTPGAPCYSVGEVKWHTSNPACYWFLLRRIIRLQHTILAYRVRIMTPQASANENKRASPSTQSPSLSTADTGCKVRNTIHHPGG